MEKDASYIKELVLGSHDAFKKLFMNYFPKVKYFVCHLIKSESIAEELAQDVFMKIWERREDLETIESFNSYVYRMAKNIALNYLRRKYLEDSYLEEYEGETESTIEGDLYVREMELLEQLTVSRMPPKRKAIYEMSRKDGLTNDEIATRMGISKKTVENHLNLALKEIRKTLFLFTSFFL
ncbi:RNA polymerase sigma-70 factor [Parabacteroides sp.]|uniref:RNA polymerase sigma-70 factor n=1 Tax=Parabacteroides sp. TaxID=1869337 RepID=UPI0030804494